MKKITLLFLLLFITLLSVTNEVIAQTIVTIGTSTSSSSSYGPFQRSSSSSTSVYSRANLVYPATELSAVGMTSGVTISQINWELGSENIIDATGNATLDIYMRNSSVTAATSDSWTNLITGSTLVGTYTFNTTNNFPGSKTWVTFTLATPFVYSGGALEVAVEWDCSGLTSTNGNANLLFTGDGSLKWRWTSTAYNSGTHRTGSSSAPSTISNLKMGRANTQFVYTVGGVLPPWSQTGSSADLVIGQPDFTTAVDQCTQNGLDGNSGIAIDFTNGKMYVVDEDNHRVLRYAYPPAGNQPNAEIVFGQPDFVTNTTPASTAANNLKEPSGVAVDASGNLFISDDGRKRILRFDAAHLIASNQPTPDGLLGQTSYTNSGSTEAANRFGSVQGIHIGPSGSLWAADDGYHRILRFDNPAAKADGADADGVLGQADFVTGTLAAAATSLNTPAGVFEDINGTLWVADQEFHRVLRFDNALSKVNGAAADGVLGQADFVTGTLAGTQGAATFDEPMDVAVDNAGRLYVIDRDNDRVTIFDDAANKANGADADAVIGQSSFSGTGAGLADNRLDNGERSSIAIDNTNNYLWISDSDNARVIRFSAASPLPVEMTYFKGNSTAEGNLLQWETATEEINEGFEVQKSLDGENWEVIGFVEGNGTTIEVSNYEFLDENTQAVNYYRLKQMDFDGAFEYSKIIMITSNKALDDKVSVYPNPTQEQLTIKGFSGILTVYNILGQPVRAFQVVNEFENVSLDGLENGQYFIEMITNDGTKTIRQIVKIN